MSNLIDLTTQKFGRYTVLERDLTKPKGRVYWLCQCECGNIKSIRGDHLSSGKIQSCGCLQKEIVGNIQLKDLIGQQFGELKVIDRAEKPKYIKDRSAYWKCLCSCGNEVIYSGHTLKIGKANSCGCLKSLGEKTITKLLKELQYDFIQQYSFSNLLSPKNTLLRFDFAIIDSDKKVQCLIEYQGSQHYTIENNSWNNENYHKRLIEYDNLKREYCIKNNIPLIEIPYWTYSKLNTKYLKELIDEHINTK